MNRNMIESKKSIREGETKNTSKFAAIAICSPPASMGGEQQKSPGRHLGSKKRESETSSSITKDSTKESKVYTYLSVCLPGLAGLLHLRVFLISLLSFLASPRSLSTVAVLNISVNLDTAVVTAYTFDLICCYMFRIIPFSRCNSARDIVGHHLPILLVFVPLNIPMYCGRFMHFNSLVVGIMGYYGDGESLRESFIDAGLRANGWGFISSLNEFFMCFQRAEMSSQGLKVFQQISDDVDLPSYSKKRRRIFTSRFAIALELYFKFGVFGIFSFFGFKACCDLDLALYQFSAKINEGMPFWINAKSILSSPSFLRTALYRIFMLMMYPKMGLRTFKKIQKFHQEASGCKEIEKASKKKRL